MEKKLTLKQTKFIKYYFENGGNATQAARQAGYKGNDQTLCVVGGENLRKPFILAAIEEIKKKNGLTEELLLQKHLQLLNAKRTQSCDVHIKNENGKWVANENSNDFIEVDDNNVQLGALKLAYELEGKLKQKLEVVGGGLGTKIILIRNVDAKPERIRDKAQVISG